MRDNIIRFGDKEIDLSKKTYIMGILNATPDSFSDGGKYNEVDAAVKHAQEMVEHGADIIDIGGESTRPGSVKVSLEEEVRRVIPIISAVREAVDVPISVDTYKAELAKQALEAGADIINDVWGAKADPDMASVAAKTNAPIILMHNREDMNYGDLLDDMIADLQESIDLCLKAGVKEENIILDPGIGFAKTYEHNLEAMRRLDEITALGYPVLLATSRKRFIAKTLDLPVDERVEGTGATVCLGIERGCEIVRVHDVLEISRMAKMMDAMLNKGGHHG
ncbi:dihydropteroate synthase [Desertibacillus haloalkaliphilus]|uniref:dihydropteroate synthase n=1 Tax=Desertibacillus haloalkaliphilus TaxID=1328930 RepID=UPI001C26803A|nr:dihydropteroate synthase [Desertibacillus haloalkaliphilus]MBU8908456.1 dihydropteroate synthase [Desertibacillus haloalkaliphilus]